MQESLGSLVQVNEKLHVGVLTFEKLDALVKEGLISGVDYEIAMFNLYDIAEQINEDKFPDKFEIFIVRDSSNNLKVLDGAKRLAIIARLIELTPKAKKQMANVKIYKYDNEDEVRALLTQVK